MNAAQSDSDRLIALGRAVEERISWLGWTYQDVHDRGGLGRAALRELINGRSRPWARSLADLDSILGWPERLCVDILEGRASVPPPDMWPERPNQYKIGVVRAGLMKLSREHDQISQQVQTNADTLRQHIATLDALRRDRD
ncbi:hypothetical protein [Mycobacteroides chelonae]|uniref:hypothetical protein n=1 Tax=Mycobacteroides chelonae TaxID=1774 RepID=UPI002230175A|nr:hypothetical protein [Mycobacteroides chelonae]